MLKAKDVKQAQMKALEEEFRGVRDLVVMTPSGWGAVDENKTRLELRKRDIRLMLVKNTLARKVLAERLGMKVGDGQLWSGPTMLAWGGTSLAGLSKDLEKTFKTNKTVNFKGAISDGEAVTFEQALKMPTKEEAIGRVVGMILGAGGGLVSRILGPASALASQIKDGIKEKAGGGAEPAAGQAGEPTGEPAPAPEAPAS